MALRYESSLDDSVRTLGHGPKRVPLYSTFAEGSEGERVRTEFYRTDSHDFARFSFDNETLYRVIQNATPANVQAWTDYDSLGGPEGYLNGLLDGGNYSVNGTVERGDRTFVQLTTGEVSLEAGHVTNGTVLVTPDGVVHDVDVTVVQSTGEDSERRFDASITLDTDVEWCGAPSWTADVPQLSLSIVEDDHAVEVRNTGETAVPTNTTFKIAGGEDPHYGTVGRPLRGDVKGTVTTDERLEPGDAVYVTAGAEGTASSFALRDDPTRGEYSFGNAGLTGGHSLDDSDSRGQPWNVSYRLATGIEPWSEAE